MRSLPAWAAYVALHHRRWPGVPSGEALHYGASYSRTALAAVGGFDERLAVGEDTDLNRRLQEMGIPSRWCPEVRATHPYPRQISTFLGEQRERGGRAARSWLLQDHPDLARQLARAGHGRGWDALRFAARYAGPGERKWILLAAPLVLAGARRYSAGARDELGAARISTAGE
jgi:GT2 family glycosyltransferase